MKTILTVAFLLASCFTELYGAGRILPGRYKDLPDLPRSAYTITLNFLPDDGSPQFPQRGIYIEKQSGIRWTVKAELVLKDFTDKDGGNFREKEGRRVEADWFCDWYGGRVAVLQDDNIVDRIRRLKNKDRAFVASPKNKPHTKFNAKLEDIKFIIEQSKNAIGSTGLVVNSGPIKDLTGQRFQGANVSIIAIVEYKTPSGGTKEYRILDSYLEQQLSIGKKFLDDLLVFQPHDVVKVAPKYVRGDDDDISTRESFFASSSNTTPVRKWTTENRDDVADARILEGDSTGLLEARTFSGYAGKDVISEVETSGFFATKTNRLEIIKTIYSVIAVVATAIAAVTTPVGWAAAIAVAFTGGTIFIDYQIQINPNKKPVAYSSVSYAFAVWANGTVVTGLKSSIDPKKNERIHNYTKKNDNHKFLKKTVFTPGAFTVFEFSSKLPVHRQKFTATLAVAQGTGDGLKSNVTIKNLPIIKSSEKEYLKIDHGSTKIVR